MFGIRLRRPAGGGASAFAASLLAGGLLWGCQAYDPGGDIRGRIAAALEAQQQGTPVAIRGACYSACALKLASGSGVCVARNAVIGVHEVRAATARDYADGARDDLFTGFFAALLPACAERLFASRHAFDSGDLVMFSGRDVLGACPQFAVCAG